MGEIDCIEKVQKFALRVCLKRWNRYAANEELRDAGDLQTLFARRNIARLSHIFKIINGKTDFPMNQLTNITVYPQYPLHKRIIVATTQQ